MVQFWKQRRTYIFVIFEISKLGENDIKRTKHDSRQHG